jgi:hypothetical protein
MATLASPHRGGRLWVFRLVLLAALVAMLEVAAWGVMSELPDSYRNDIRISDETLVATFLEARPSPYSTVYDPALGWDYAAGWQLDRRHSDGSGWLMTMGADGGRSDPQFAGATPLVATYGDSFTASWDVNDDQTWQYHLARALGGYVANFGVGGYGPDQALLKFKLKHAERPAPKWVVLGIWESESIERTLSRYRAYQWPDTNLILGFKPRFVREGDGLRLLPNVMQARPTNEAEFRDLLDAAKEGDALYASRAARGFPYTVNLARLLLAVAADRTGADLSALGALPSDLWRDAGSVELLRAIVADFAATATARGARPVVLFIPDVAAWRHGPVIPRYTGFTAALRAGAAGTDLLVVDVAEAEFEPERFNIRPFVGHASAYGDEIIAHHLEAAMRGR